MNLKFDVEFTSTALHTPQRAHELADAWVEAKVNCGSDPEVTAVAATVFDQHDREFNLCLCLADAEALAKALTAAVKAARKLA